MGAVGGAERVVHVLVGERGERGGERPGRSSLPPAWNRRFSSSTTPPPPGAWTRSIVALHLVADAIVDKRDRAAEQLRQPVHNRPQAELRILLAFRAPQVAREDHGRARVERVLNRRNGPAQPRVVADAPVFQRHVEVDPDENALALQVEVFDGSFGI